jgi:aminopeptidase
MVKLLKDDGELWFDEQIIQKEGRSVHKELIALNPSE